jgi:hypothetical protein
MTTMQLAMPKNRTLLWAAGVGALWTVLLIASSVGCATGLTRPDNLIAFAISIGCVALMGGAALRPIDGLRRAAQFAAGLLGGMFFGPSTGALLSLVLVGLGLSDALRGRNRLVGVVLVVVGFVLGYLLTYEVLMRFFAPTDIRC